MIHWLVSQVATGHCTNKALRSDEIPDDLTGLEAVAARPVQQQFWLLQQLVPDVGVINIASKLSWQGPLDPRVLQDALYDLVCRHQYLRTTVEYRNEHLVQITHPPGAPAVELIDLQTVPLAERPATRDAVLREAAQRPMPIDLVPAIRCQVVRLDQHQHEVVLIVSHLISDGLSMGVLCADLMHACVARLQGQPATWKTGARVNLSPLPAEPDPQGQFPTIDLPCDFAPPATPSYRGQRLEFSIPAEATRQLVSLSRQHRVSPFVTWMSLVQTVIYAWTREPLIPVDFPMSGRDRSMRRCVGPFLQSATAELAADDTISFASLVQQNSQCVDSATGQARQAHGRRPQLLLDYQTALDEVKLTDAITVMPGELDNGVALAELRVGVRRRRRCFDIHIDFDTDRFAPATARRFAAQLQQTMQLVTTNPETPLGQIELLTEQDRQLVQQINQTARPFDCRQLVDQAIQRRLSHTPAQLAMVDQRHSVSCEQLNRQVESICQDLRSRNIVRGDRVAILMDRSSQAVAAMLATMKCGAAFVPVDPGYPEPRRQQILEAADVRCIVTDAQHRHLVPPETAVVVDQLPLDESPKSPSLPDDHAQPSARNSDDVAYVLFTSGSTGTPKGVQVTHRNLANFLAAMDDLHDTPPDGCWLAVTSMSFDISLFELLWTLSRGLQVVIEHDPLGLTPGGQVRLARRMQEHQITHLQCTPALMQALLREPAVREAVQRLDKLFVGGDVMPVELASDLSELVDGDVFNMYGPTETTIWSTAWRLPDDVSKVVIGRPLANTTVYVLDQHRRLLPPGIAGELYIGGEGVAAGYFRDAGQTRRRFVDCPRRGRLFRTGDRVRMQESGEIEFLGRIDQQVKLNGHRIELGEIEYCLRQHPAVEDAVAVLIDSPQTKTLAAFVIASRNRSTQLDHHELLNHVRNRMPVWMVPAYMETLDRFPLTPSGKLDRRQLAAWPRPPSGSAPGALPQDIGQNGRESPHAALAERVRHLVMDTLQLEQLPANTRMADLDIDSLQVVRLASCIERDLGTRISMATFFRPRPLVELIIAAMSNGAVNGLPSRTSPTDEPAPKSPAMESSSIGRLERASQSFHETIQDTSLHPYARFVDPVKSELLARAGLDKTFVRGEGCHLWDRDGERYLDFVAQYGALPFGYNPPRIWESLQFTRQRMLPSTATSSLLDSAGQLAQRLLQLVPYMQHVVFCNSGAECTEVAIKLCRSATGRDRILSTRHGFHGLTTGAAGATGSKEFRDGFVSDQENFGHVPFGNVEALRQTLEQHADKIAAFIVEPIQGEAGIIVPPDGYIGQVRDLCSRYGVLMVVDEVQTGLGRTGHLLACDRHGVMPDVLLLAKALGGGLVPAGAVLCQSHAYSDRFGMRHSSTFAGNALACQAGLAALDWLQEDDQALIRHVASTGEFLHTGLLTIKQTFPAMVRDVRGSGFMQAIEFDFSTLDRGPGLLGFLAEQEMLVHLVASHLLNMHYVRVAPSFVGREVLRIEPPLIAGRDECQRLVSALHDTMQILGRRNTAVFLAPLAGTTPQRVLQNSQGITSTTRTAKTGDAPTAAADYRVTNKFGFLIHLSSLEDFARFDESLAVFDHAQLAQLKSQLVRSSDPFVIGSNDFVSSRGVAARGHFVIVPWTPAELQSMPVDEALEQVTRAAEVAAGQGVELIGLGGFTSIVSMGGAALPLAKLPPVTSGNSLTVAATLTALQDTCANCGTDLHNSTAAIVGAAGQTGRGLAIMLGEQVDRLVLIGRNGEQPSSRQRLRQVAAAIVDHLVDANADWQSTAGPLARDVRQFDLGNRDQLLEKLLGDGRIVLAGHLDELATADVIVTASSATQSFIESAHLRRGAIVVDASRPANVAPSVRDRRPDVRWIEGGVMEIPGSPPLDLFAGPHPNHTFACVAEAALWALHPEVRGLSAAISLEPARIRRLGLLARQNGFRVVTGQDQHS